MLTSLHEAEQVATELDVPTEDVLLVTLNHCGLSNDDLGQRTRIVLAMQTRPDDQIHLILALRRPDSPFAIRGSRGACGRGALRATRASLGSPRSRSCG
jgi:hypothetical protein